ncbi:MAG: hypothetical protein MRK00_03635 [Nitrosomonas sp.]|nr:hypothetical protein [Nitrosomonas sp.]
MLRKAVRAFKQRHPFYIDAFVVLPDHLHAIWSLPEQHRQAHKRDMENLSIRYPVKP